MEKTGRIGNGMMSVASQAAAYDRRAHRTTLAAAAGEGRPWELGGRELGCEMRADMSPTFGLTLCRCHDVVVLIALHPGAIFADREGMMMKHSRRCLVPSQRRDCSLTLPLPLEEVNVLDSCRHACLSYGFFKVVPATANEMQEESQAI